MAFSFAFSNDDVGSDDETAIVPPSAASARSPAASQVPVRCHKLDDLVGKTNHQAFCQGFGEFSLGLRPNKATGSEKVLLR